SVHGVDPGNQRLGVDSPCGDQPDELLEVALLRPADVPERVVHPALLITVVVASGPVGTRIPQVDLAVQEVLRVDVELDVADNNYPALPPGDLHRPVDDLWRVRARADDRGVDPVLTGESVYPALPVRVGRVDHEGGAGCGSQLVRLRVDIDPDDDASGRLRD